MNLKQLVFGIAGAAVLAAAAPQTATAQLWYNGEFNGLNATSSETNTAVSQSIIFDNFTVGGAGWTVTSIFGDYLSNSAWLTADYEVRSGVSEGNGGTLLFSGSGLAASRVATGRSGFGLNEYRATITGLNFFLGAGTYWLGISPIGFGTDRTFLSRTSGLNGVNAVTDGNAYMNSAFFGANYQAFITGPSDYAYGIDGRVGGTEEVVPEPATMTLLATGLLGMAGARRRKKTTA
jgi:hypothetical protein